MGKYIALSFSSSSVICNLNEGEWEMIDDIPVNINNENEDDSDIKGNFPFFLHIGQTYERETKKSFFEKKYINREEIYSDGVGFMSKEIADLVCQKLSVTSTSAIQIRFAGFKGVLSLNPTLSKKKIQLRKSMFKFECPHNILEVIDYSKFIPITLNEKVFCLLLCLYLPIDNIKKRITSFLSSFPLNSSYYRDKYDNKDNEDNNGDDLKDDKIENEFNEDDNKADNKNGKDDNNNKDDNGDKDNDHSAKTLKLITEINNIFKNGVNNNNNNNKMEEEEEEELSFADYFSENIKIIKFLFENKEQLDKRLFDAIENHAKKVTNIFSTDEEEIFWTFAFTYIIKRFKLHLKNKNNHKDDNNNNNNNNNNNDNNNNNNIIIENNLVNKESLYGKYIGIEGGISKLKEHIYNDIRKKYLVKNKFRLPIKEGGQFIGVLDYTGSLKSNQMFLQIDRMNNNENKEIIKGRAIVYRDPHPIPNDIRTVELIDVPELHHLVNCAVFPASGFFPLHLQCSGGDLDGDKYYVIWDPDFTQVKSFPCLFSFSVKFIIIIINNIIILIINNIFINILLSLLISLLPFFLNISFYLLILLSLF